jgi:hypothetical protein
VSIFDRIVEYSNISKPSERVPKEDGGMRPQLQDTSGERQLFGKGTTLASQLPVEDYVTIVKEMVADKNYVPTVNINFKETGRIPNFLKAKEIVKQEMGDGFTRAYNANVERRKKLKQKYARKLDPQRQTEYLAKAAETKSRRRIEKIGPDVSLSPREAKLNLEQRKIAKKLNEAIRKNPDLILKNEALIDQLSTTIDKDGNIIKVKPSLTDIKNRGIYEIEHQRDIYKTGKMKDFPYNRNLILGPYNRTGGFKKMAEKFIEKFPDPSNPKVQAILEKADELGVTIRPNVPEGTFPTKALGYKQLPDPIEKFKAVAEKVTPSLKSELFPDGDQAGLSNISSNQEKKILENITSYSKLSQCKVGRAEGGRIGFALSDECIRDGLIEQKKLAASGNKKAAQELVDVAKVASRGGLLKNVLGPGAILGEAVFEGAIIGNKVLGGKPLNQAWAESYLSYLDPRKYKGELDSMLMERDRMLQSTADKNILRSGFSAQDQLSAFNKAIEERDLAKSRGRIDQYLPAAAEAREQGRLAGQSADVISSEAFKDATKVAQEYLQGQSGKQQADFGVLSVAQGDDPINLRRLKAMRKMKNLYTQYSDKDLIKMLQDAGYNPQDIIDLKTTERLTPSFARTLGGLDVLRSQFQEQEAMQRIADAGGVANLAGGGIAKLAGVSKGPPPESGPNPQGLNYLIKRVTNS